MKHPSRSSYLAVAAATTVVLAACAPSGPDSHNSPFVTHHPVQPTPTPIDEESISMTRPLVLEAYRQEADLAGAPASASKTMERGELARRHAVATGGIVMPPVDRERYAHFDDNPLKRTVEQPVSTFSVDVDTGAYANVRRILVEGRLPQADAVRVEEFINYFGYADPLPENQNMPFRVTTEIGPSPWNPATRLLRIGIRAWDLPETGLPPANLVFLVDVSGSMQSPDKLPLLKQSLRLLAKRLDGDDRLSLVAYAGASGIVLETTAGDQQAKIFAAIDGLEAGGSTNGAAGIALAYAQARQGFVEGGINRVILATDGDFNVGTVNHEALVNLIERERASGVSLTTLGFGGGNYNDQLMEQLADHGDGNHAYIDTLLEAQKVLVDEMGATLYSVARDVKIQVEFNPALVSEYRLVGYENRVLAREDFSNDQVDAGEIGAGHSVVALYELALAGASGQRVDPLRYGPKQVPLASNPDELGFLRLRFKRPDQARSELLEQPILMADVVQSLDATSDDYRFTAAVGAFGQRLRGGKYLEGFGYDDIVQLAQGARGQDPQGTRADLLRVVRLAASLDHQPAVSAVR